METYFAKIDENNIVETVIVADQNFIFSQPGTWVETFMDGGSRKNFAGKGYSYDAGRDAFIAPKPYPSWSLNESTCQWEAPFPMPDNIHTNWDEDGQQWL